jgi:Flp pilus assembly CpaE family ATPase
MENELIRVLLIEDNPGDTRMIRELFREAKSLATSFNCADRLSSGLARLAEDGADVVLLDLSLPDSTGFATFRAVHAQAKGVPVIVLTGFDDEELAMNAVRSGAQDYIAKGAVNAQSLTRSIRFAVERNRKMAAAATSSKPEAAPGNVLGFFGAKGGVGATTVALNAAAILARQGKAVIALELRPFGGSFGIQTQQTPARTLHHLLELDVEQITEAEFQKHLVSLPFGAKALFAPQRPEEFKEMQPGQAEAIIRCAARLADHVVIDLPSTPSLVNQAAIRQCDHVTLVVERNPACIAEGARVVKLLRSWGVEDRCFDAAIVVREGLVGFLSPSEIAALLGCGIAGVIPPAAEVCLAASRSGTPFAVLEPDNIATASLIALAAKLAEPALLRRPSASSVAQ